MGQQKMYEFFPIREGHRNGGMTKQFFFTNDDRCWFPAGCDNEGKKNCFGMTELPSGYDVLPGQGKIIRGETIWDGLDFRKSTCWRMSAVVIVRLGITCRRM
jgi:hypothetical protein